MAGWVQMLEGLDGRLTHVRSVRECPHAPGSKTCCAHKRDTGEAKPGNFKKLCDEAGLTMIVGGEEPRKRLKTPAAPAPLEDSHMARRRHRRHAAALAEYGEPLGDVGFLGDFLDTRDLKDFGFVAAAGLATAVVAPKVTALVDKIGFIPFGARAYVKGAVGVAGGFAMYKYLGRRVPAKYRDAVVAASGVMAGLGVSTIAHELLDKGVAGAKLKGLHGLGDLFPMTLKDVGDAEMAMLAELNAIEASAVGADMDPNFGADMDPAFGAFDASVEPEDGWAFDADVEPGQLNGFDASVEPENAWEYEEDVDLDAVAMQQM